jgi:hypothetical protein
MSAAAASPAASTAAAVAAAAEERAKANLSQFLPLGTGTMQSTTNSRGAEQRAERISGLRV